MSTEAPITPGEALAATRWTLVVRARGETPEARAALAELCEAYYPVVERFIRRQAPDPQAARDLTHDFFARVLGGSGLRGADQAQGRFRSYLLGAVKHFLSVERARWHTAKRGGGRKPVSIDATAADPDGGWELPDPRAASPEAEFDREWATAMLDRALDRLASAMAADGKGRQFEVLKPCLTGTGDLPRQAALAKELGLNESALKVAIHRLRKRFRETMRREIAETLNDPGGVDEEMRHLVQALSGRM